VGDDPGATGGDVNPDAGSSGADAPTGTGPACTTSSTCPATTPTCTNGVCTACDPKQTPSDCSTFHAATPKCGPAGACVECVSGGDDAGASPECAQKATAPFCGPNNTCVECLTANHCAPHVCGNDNACRPCQKHSECPAGACGEDGNCVAGSMIAYVDNGGMTHAACAAARQPINGNTLASAYCGIDDALGGKPYVVVIGHGAAAPYGAFSATGTVTIIGPGGSVSTPAVVGGSLALPASGNVIDVISPGAAPGVTIDGFEVTSTSSSSTGLHCKATVAGRLLRLRNSYVHDVHGDALYNENCNLVLEDNKVSGTDIRAIEDANTVTPVTYTIQRNVFANGNADGVYVDADLTFDRNTVSNYTAGNGLQVNGSNSYRITNSFFFLNRTGVDFNTSGTPPVRVFQFNTVAFNGSNAFYCGTGVIESSIVTNNADAPSSLSGCTTSHVVSDDAGAPAFVNSNDPSKYDFHLAVDTAPHVSANMACCIDKVPPTFDAGAPLPDHDYDGTKRPKGGGYDIGAHEAQ